MAENPSVYKAFVVAVEGIDGTGKTTFVSALHAALKTKDVDVIVLKEPGDNRLGTTMILRELMLNSAHDAEMTRPARELISQACRSILYERILLPVVKKTYSRPTVIVTDRSMISGMAYGEACGNHPSKILELIEFVVPEEFITPTKGISIYDVVIYIRVTGEENFKVVQSRSRARTGEFEKGDAIEARGLEFQKKVSENLDRILKEEPYFLAHVKEIPFDPKVTTEQMVKAFDSKLATWAAEKKAEIKA